MSFADPAAVAAINAWVRRQTRGRITKLLDQIDPSTVLVLANAVYLKATWLNQFSESGTSHVRFTTAATGPVSASLMRHQLHNVPYTARNGWQRVTLPYVVAS